ncbi:MAG: hypothetical protein C0614_04655 [Desulfuromonas sp.]|nr:MAG: hypothetical protein C0614_04655 [Desulfuromonas sp.]
MLLSGTRQSNARQVAIVTRNPVLLQILTALLGDWGFSVVEPQVEPGVVFLEHGLAEPTFTTRTVLLTSMPVSDRSCLLTPISLTRLYHLLEDEFFPSPRRHIRVNTEIDADLQIDGAWQPGNITSLSDRGCRVTCDYELPAKQPLVIEFRLGERRIRLSAQVLYCIPAGETASRAKPQFGVQFKQIDPAICTALRASIERKCLERAFRKIDIDPAHPVNSWFEQED